MELLPESLKEKDIDDPEHHYLLAWTLGGGRSIEGVLSILDAVVKLSIAFDGFKDEGDGEPRERGNLGAWCLWSTRM